MSCTKQTQLYDLQQQHQQLSDSPCKNLRYLYRAVAILMLNTLILFACFELAARGVFKIASMNSKPTAQLVGEGAPREKVSYYSSQYWAVQYWYEFRLSRTQRYYPYVGWRRAPFKGQTIEIDQHGVRVTPGADCRANSFKVFTFGASEMWGTGSPDWDTIPANLQKGFAKLRLGPVCVMNFAESAYVLMQDVIMLLVQLRSGNVPDVALFYNVESNIYAAYQSGRVGDPENLVQLATKFEGRREPSTFVDQLRSTVNGLRSTDSYALIDWLIGKLTIANPQLQEPTPRKLITFEGMGLDAAKLSDLIVQDYMGNYKIVSALAQQYGFKYSFFLPPIISLGDKPLTPEEQEMRQKTEINTAYSQLYQDVYRAMERKSSEYPNIYSINHIFDHFDSLIWIDEGHVTPIGNRAIAERMLDVIQTRSPDEK